MKAIYITKDGQIGDARDLLIVKNLSDNRVELLEEAPANLRQRLAFEFADYVSDTLYFTGKIWKSTGEQNKDIAWDWLTNDYETEYNKVTQGYDTYKNGVLVTKENNPIPKFFDVVNVDALINN